MKKTCYNCEHRTSHSDGDSCGKGDFPLTDSRFNRAHELLRLKHGRPCYCPLAERENNKADKKNEQSLNFNEEENER